MVKAIETVYNGYRFRSRLEARWAVFFDSMGLAYSYEIEGFDMGFLGKYLPDFFLHNFRAFVEIKPRLTNNLSNSRDFFNIRDICQKLSEVVTNTLLIVGNPYYDEYKIFVFVKGQRSGSGLFSLCAKCGNPGIVINRKIETYKSIPFEWHTSTVFTCSHREAHDPHISRLHDSYTAARQARFEYGEKPRI